MTRTPTPPTTFIDHTPDTAPEASRAALRAAAAKFGFVPSAMARLAESPSVVAAFGRLLAIWEESSLSLVEREVVTLTVAHHAGCEVCMAIHSAVLARGVGDAELLEALRAQSPIADRRLEALRGFTRAVLETRGGAGGDELRAFLAAGFSRRNALDVVLGVGTYTLSTYANRLTSAPLDPSFAEHEWHAARAPGRPESTS